MKLGESGVAYFVEPNFSGEQVPRYLATSPVHDSDIEHRINSQLPPNVSLNSSVSFLYLLLAIITGCLEFEVGITFLFFNIA